MENTTAIKCTNCESKGITEYMQKDTKNGWFVCGKCGSTSTKRKSLIYWKVEFDGTSWRHWLGNRKNTMAYSGEYRTKEMAEKTLNDRKAQAVAQYGEDTIVTFEEVK
ncbi:TFIIB-type zinc ribbon-containing protein [Candidatus Roizmanbacteria bacterium]|nr:TFIIB-type zinc ribbon-containing protein [Candidatus Roizmanbacteria bacterium]